jgi:c-di-GMP-binding flagellar brake protein YcgR
MLCTEMREIRSELCAMHRQQRRTAARVRALEDGRYQCSDFPLRTLRPKSRLLTCAVL